MKKILFFCLIALFASCSAEEELQGMSAESTAMLKELENVTNGYELMIKGYSLEEIQREKDETPKNDKVETAAEPWMIKAIRDSLDKITLSYGNKTRADAYAYTRATVKVGVFKYGTCGNNREFTYFMDCEDGGDSSSRGSIGSSEVDANGNVRFRFCLVDPGNYGGGVLLLCDYTWGTSSYDIKIVERYHDDQDGNNKNKIEDNGGLLYTGPTIFSANTKFFWIYDDSSNRKTLPFVYGVVDNLQIPLKDNVIHTDDEDTRNGNEAYLHAGANSRQDLNNENFGNYYRGIQAGRNTDYYIKIRTN